MACSARGSAGLVLITLALQASAQTTPSARHSGLDDMSPALQAMQRDDSQNPAMLAVQDGAALWSASPGAGARSCRDCHGDAPTTMRGVAARYPAWDITTQQALNLSGRINACRQRHQRQPPLAPDHPDSLGLSSFLGLQSRGWPVSPPDDVHLARLREQGRTLWHLRQGQLNLSCAQCHDQRAGQRLGGALIPEAHANGYPTYRLEWQGLGSLQRRLERLPGGCTRAAYGPGANEWLALEAWMAMRDRGMPVETPAVRP